MYMYIYRDRVMLNFQDRMGKVQKEFKVGTCENFITNLYFKMTTYIYIYKTVYVYA